MVATESVSTVPAGKVVVDAVFADRESIVRNGDEDEIAGICCRPDGAEEREGTFEQLLM